MNFRTFKQVLVATALSVASVVTLNSCDKDDDNNNNRTYTISGNAVGNQVVPSVAGTGTGSISGTYDPNTRVLTYNTGWTGLTGAPTSAGFYSGTSGASGTLVGNPWTFGANPGVTGNTNGSMTLTPDQGNQLTTGGWYYTYGTSANPGGEVRGQITTTQQ